jgi:hypothetical protein
MSQIYDNVQHQDLKMMIDIDSGFEAPDDDSTLLENLIFQSNVTFGSAFNNE